MYTITCIRALFSEINIQNARELCMKLAVIHLLNQIILLCHAALKHLQIHKQIRIYFSRRLRLYTPIELLINL